MRHTTNGPAASAGAVFMLVAGVDPLKARYSSKEKPLIVIMDGLKHKSG